MESRIADLGEVAAMLLALLLPLALASLAFALILLRAAVERRAVPRPEGLALGAVTNFSTRDKS